MMGFSSKHAATYCLVEQALDEGRDLVLDGFRDFHSALLLTQALRRRFDDRANIKFTKYGHNGAIEPRIHISQRAL